MDQNASSTPNVSKAGRVVDDRDDSVAGEAPSQERSDDRKEDAASQRNAPPVDNPQNAQRETEEDRLLSKWRKKAPNADLHLAEMLESYQKYRYSALALGVCCVGLIGSSMALYANGVIDGATQTSMILGSYLFIGIMLFLVFARVRPLKKDISAWNDALNAAIAPSSKKKKTDPEPMSQSKRKKNPDTPEFKRWRRLWRLCIFVAVIIMLSAMVLIRLNPDDVTVALIVLTSSYIFLALAVYLERSKMKPLREEWQAQQDKAEKKAKRKAERKAASSGKRK